MCRMKRTLTAISIVFLVSVTFPYGAAASEFATPKSYPVGTSPTDVVIADFNGDGKPDIAVVNSGSNNVSILLGNGDGTFQPARNFDVGNSMTNIFAGDFNGDGKLDLAVFLPGNASNSIAGEVRILLGNGDGTFQAPLVTGFTIAAKTLAVGDFNGDKKADLILSNVDPNSSDVTLEQFLGKGDGSFQAPNQIPVSGLDGTVFAIADFNKDGKLDLAVAVTGGVQVLFGKGDGTFQAAGVVAVGPNVVTMLTGDFNGDSHIDLLVYVQPPTPPTPPCKKPNPFAPCPPPPPTPPPLLSFFPGQGDGTFAGGAIVGQGLVCCILIGNFNADGTPDVIDGAGNIYLGRGNQTLAGPFPTAAPAKIIAVHDLNGDKLDDLVALDPPNNALLVFLNDSPTSGADLDIVSAGPSGAKFGSGFNFEYSADVFNAGPEDATNFSFTDTLPSNVTFVSATSTPGSCLFSTGVVTCHVDSLANLADAQIRITVTPTATGPITNTMIVSATQPDLAPDNNSASQTNTVLPSYTLTVGKTGTGSGTVTETGHSPLNSGNGMIDCGATCSAKFLAGTNVSLNAGSDTGDFFTGWGGACSGNSSCTITMSGDQTVTANFVKGSVLSVTLSGSGAGIVEDQGAHIFVCTSTNGDCFPSLLPGSTISIQAIPSGSSTFGSWSGACSGSDPNNCTIVMSSNQLVTATFNPPPDFSLSAASPNLTTTSGGQVTDMISISEQGGFSSAIQLACSVAGPAPTSSCALSPNSIPPGPNSPTSKLTFTAGTLAASMPASLSRTGTLSACLLLFGMLGGMLALRFDDQQRKILWLSMMILLVAMIPAACGGGGNVPPPPVSRNYAVTVTATSGAIQHATTISIIVQ